MYTLVLLSGGTGKRMHNSVPKQYMLLAGKPVIMHILERVDRLPFVSDVIVVCADRYIAPIQLMLNQYGVQKKVRFAQAGTSRQASVFSGLKLVKTEDVIIHEAARPFVKAEDFEDLINEESQNAMFGLDIPFTVIKGCKYVEGLLTRSELVNVQLPQKFETRILLEAHEKAEQEGLTFTEDASMVYHYNPGIPIKICKGHEYNIKLTTRMDMLIGEQIYDEVFRGRK